MEKHIRTLLREVIERIITPFKDITNIPDYDKLMLGLYDELPNNYRDIVANVTYMSPREYLEECAELQDSTYEDQLDIVDGSYGRVKVNRLIKLIKDGIKLDMPYLNWVDGQVSQEGRHRAKAAMDLNIAKIPVLVITSKIGKNKRIKSGINLSDKLGVWDDLIEHDGVYYVRFNMDNIDELILLERCIIDSDEYFIDDIISSRIYRKSLLDIVRENKTNYNIKIGDVVSFIDKFPHEYEVALKYDENDEQEWEKRLEDMIPSLRMLSELFIMEHNEHELYGTLTYDGKIAYLSIDEDLDLHKNYNSGKDMLLDMQIYKDELNLYNIYEGDYYNMSDKFIEKHNHLLPKQIGNIKI